MIGVPVKRRRAMLASIPIKEQPVELIETMTRACAS
jgi:hypothetical protein